jgi:hypothetical protein
MALTEENKAQLDLDHFEYMLKFGENYVDAPDGSEQRIAYELGSDTCKTIQKMINKVNENSIAVDGKKHPLKVFEYLKHLMEYANSLSKFCDGTCEKDAFNMSEQKREKVLQMITIIREFNPFQ